MDDYNRTEALEEMVRLQDAFIEEYAQLVNKHRMIILQHYVNDKIGVILTVTYTYFGTESLVKSILDELRQTDERRELNERMNGRTDSR